MFNKILKLILLIVFATLVLFPKTTRAQTPAATFTVGTPSTSTFYESFQGFGAEWDPFFWNTNNQNRGLTQSDWNLITNRIKSLQPGILRIMMQLNWATSDPNLVNWNYNSPQMQSVFKYLDFACQNNIDVVLTDWGWSVRSQLYSSPTDSRFGTGVAQYMKEFIDTRGYSCIKYLVIGNEPDNEIQKDYGQAAYETMYRNVDQALKNNGMRTKVKLTGPDMGGTWDFMKTSVSDLKDILDTYDFHRYASTDETSNTNLPGTWESLWDHLDLWRREVNSRDTNGANKLLLLTEMGNAGGGTNSHPSIDTYDYALHMADYGTTLLKTRVNAGIAWCMHDVYYFDGGQFMQWGMWKYKNDNWALRPWAQTFGLLMRNAPRGSVVAPVNNTPPNTPALSQYRASALKRPDGGWNIFLVNRTTSAVTYRVVLPTAPQFPLSRYQIDRSTFQNNPNTLLVEPIATVSAGLSMDVAMPAESFVVLTELTSSSPTSTPTPAVQLAKVAINVSAINTSVSNKSTGLSALAYNSSNQPIWSGVTYDWGMSSSNSIGTVNPILGNISNFTPKNAGTGDLFVTARYGSQSVTASIRVTVTAPSPTPTPKPGDVDGGDVTLSDLAILLANFGGSEKTRAQGDVANNDGLVNLSDLSLLLANFGR